MSTDSPTRYAGLLQALHWTTAVLVLCAFILGPGGSEEHVYSVGNDLARRSHESLGICVFVLTFVRLALRLKAHRKETAVTPRWLAVLAKLGHLALYLLLFGVPLTAILGAWFEGHAVTLLGHLDLASPFARTQDIGATLATIHGWLGDTLIWLAGLHAVAGLFHHVVLRDDVLVNMLPTWLPGGFRARR